MSFAPGSFHVYFIGADPNSNQNYTQKSPLYLVTFSSRSEADKYWRYLPYSYPKNMDTFRRFSPQLIKAPLPNLENGWKCIIQTLKDEYQVQQTKKPLIAPSDQRLDNINGLTCYIRNVSRQQRSNYWENRNNNTRIGFDTYTYDKYLIRRATSLEYNFKPEEDVLIAEDYVNIFHFNNTKKVVKWRESGEREVELYSEDYSGETPQEPNEKFKFSFFTDGRPKEKWRFLGIRDLILCTKFWSRTIN